MPIPKVVIIAPPPVSLPKGIIAPKFIGADSKSVGLAGAFEEMAKELNCFFFDSGKVISSSVIDGVHLDAEQHAVLGRALAKFVGELLPAG